MVADVLGAGGFISLRLEGDVDEPAGDFRRHGEPLGTRRDRDLRAPVLPGVGVVGAGEHGTRRREGGDHGPPAVRPRAGTSVRRDAGWRSKRAYVRTWSVLLSGRSGRAAITAAHLPRGKSIIEQITVAQSWRALVEPVEIGTVQYVTRGGAARPDNAAGP